jgi:cardiolipin synthase
MAAVEAHRQTGARGRHKRRPHKPLAPGVSGVSQWWQRIREEFTWWEITVFIIGVIALVSVLSALFFAVGDRPTTITTDGPVPAVESLEFATALSALVDAPIDHGGTVTVLNNGDEFVPALLQSIRDARKSINFSVYIWKDGEMADQVLPLLVAAQQRGVAVRILLDGFGASIADKKFDPLIAAGGHVQKFRTPKLGQLTRFHRRNHRRSIVIDGELGFTGGMAVSDVWLGHAQDPDHWRDLMFKLTGPLAKNLQAAFADTWVSSTGEILVGADMYPVSAASAPGVERFIHLANSPADDHEAMEYFFLLPILAARDSVFLVTPYFIPDPHLSLALQQKARAGVDVRLLVPGPNNDNKLERASSHRRYDDLLTAGVKIYEYQPTFIHAKSAVIDGAWTVIGSPNLNFRSRQLDQENAIGILDRPLAAQLRQDFQQDLKKSLQINLDQWRRRNPFERMVEWSARLLDQQS